VVVVYGQLRLLKRVDVAASSALVHLVGGDLNWAWLAHIPLMWEDVRGAEISKYLKRNKSQREHQDPLP
jgi:hypothetical protein